jgi:hypothetical protein
VLLLGLDLVGEEFGGQPARPGAYGQVACAGQFVECSQRSVAVTLTFSVELYGQRETVEVLSPQQAVRITQLLVAARLFGGTPPQKVLQVGATRTLLCRAWIGVDRWVVVCSM